MKLSEKLFLLPSEYKSIPFWSWNEDLKLEVLIQQINQMHEQGIGGFIMHARSGLITDYMSENWFSLIQNCCLEAEKLGMDAWVYDEFGWPSGTNNGKITSENVRYSVHWIEFINSNELKNTSNNTSQVIEYKDGSKIFIKTNEDYVDLLNKEVVQKFITDVYGVYDQHAKKNAYKIKGFFTDEPQFAREKTPYSPVIEKEFYLKYGYSPLEKLPLLFIESDDYQYFRYQYWTLIHDLFVTSFGKQLFDWCEEHNYQLTGHAMLEDSVFTQMQATAGVMSLYQYFHIPGVDWLRKMISTPIMPKQLGSVAAQTGKQHALTETYALCGWDVDFSELKWIAEWQYVNGVNMTCQHLQSYSLAGSRKRDFPASLFIHQSWWVKYKSFNDYMTRLSIILTSGHPIVNTLVIHPMKCAYLHHNNTYNQKISNIERNFDGVCNALSDLHLDYHLGDEDIIASLGKIQNDKFTVGKCHYKIVILPSMESITNETFELLNEFVNAGGVVLVIGALPSKIDGLKNNKISVLANRFHVIGFGTTIYSNLSNAYQEYPFINAEINEFYRKNQLRTISIRNPIEEIKYIHYQERIGNDGHVFYMVNHSLDACVHAEVELNVSGIPCLYDPMKNTYTEIDYQLYGDTITVKLDFTAKQSHILFVKNKKNDFIDIRCDDFASKPTKIYKTKKQWEIVSCDDNCLTLDSCRYETSDFKGTNKEPITKINEDLLRRHYEGELNQIFEIDMHHLPSSIYLVIESINKHVVEINGVVIDCVTDGYYKDPAFNKVKISNYLRLGLNKIVLRSNYYQRSSVYDVLFGENVLESEVNKLTYDTEIENIYLVGGFSVLLNGAVSQRERNNLQVCDGFTIAKPVHEIESTNFVEQGFPFYSDKITISQSITMHKDGSSIMLELPNYHAVVAVLRVNKNEYQLLFNEMMIDITSSVSDGNNKIEVEFFFGNRNMLGPHHDCRGENISVDPGSFLYYPNKNNWTDDYLFVKNGFI